MSNNNLQRLMESILNAPLWVQEVIYLDIKNHLEKTIPLATNQTQENEIYPAYYPEITYKGRHELETHEHNLDFNVYKYLKCALDKQRVIDITLNNFWTLEESSSYLALCIKMEMIKPPVDTVVNAEIFYLAGEIRLGEYVKRINKINIDELDDILRRQKHRNENNPDTRIKIGEIMVEMGLVANKDIDKIIYIKNEAKKRFIITNSPSATSIATSNNAENNELIKKLTAENKLLKDKLRVIFNIQNKKKQL